MRSNTNLYLILSALFMGFILLCRPTLALSVPTAVTPAVNTTSSEVPSPSPPTSPTLPNDRSDIVIPKKTDSIPGADKPTDVKNPATSGQTLPESQKQPLTVPSQGQSNDKSIQKPLHSTTNIPYPEHRTPSGSSAHSSGSSTKPTPATPSTIVEGSRTPPESTPGALKSNATEYPRTPFVPQGDPRPLNERPTDTDNQTGAQRQFD